MLMIVDLEEALKKAPYPILLEMFEAILVSYYTADNPQQQQEIGRLVIAVASAASLRGEDSCSRDLADRDSLIRNAVIRSTLKTASLNPIEIFLA